MKILVGPDSLKGSISAIEFCKIVEEHISNFWPNDEVVSLPLADGGEGTVDALVASIGGRIIELEVTGPLGKPVIGKYGLLHNDSVAVIEMADASGLSLIPVEDRNPMITTTFGTGELILDAVNSGCKKIIIGIGGSATSDAGVGMMQALGFKCLDEDGESVSFGGNGLLKLRKIEKPEVDIFYDIDIQVACDVKNPLYGLNGASHVYGRQKGADDNMIEELDKGLINFSEVCKTSFGIYVSELQGGGAAGGLGAGLKVALDGKLLQGFEIIRELVNLDSILEDGVDLVITAEGQMNHQSLNGKLPVELAKLADRFNIPTIAIVGSMDIDFNLVKDTGIVGVYPIVDGPMTLSESMSNSKELICKSVHNVLTTIHHFIKE